MSSISSAKPTKIWHEGFVLVVSDNGEGSVFAWGSYENIVNTLKMKRQSRQENLRLPEIL